MTASPDRIATEDDPGIPERAKRGNPDRPDRVPTPGHEGGVRVSDKLLRAENRRRDTAQGHVEDDTGLVE